MKEPALAEVMITVDLVFVTIRGFVILFSSPGLCQSVKCVT